MIEGLGLGVCDCVPQAHRASASSGDEGFTIRRESHRHHLIVVSVQGHGLVWIGQGLEADIAVAATGGEAPVGCGNSSAAMTNGRIRFEFAPFAGAAMLALR